MTILILVTFGLHENFPWSVIFIQLCVDRLRSIVLLYYFTHLPDSLNYPYFSGLLLHFVSSEEDHAYSKLHYLDEFNHL